jgi:mRNA-degrading endonuclease RelE of RelBE toxin-antitoxin system
MRESRPFYSDLAAEALLALPKRRQRKLVDTCNRLARNPSIRSDYRIRDADGRDVEHIRVEGFVIASWVDDSACKVMIVEVDDVR